MQIWYLAFQLLLQVATSWTGGKMLFIFVDEDLERGTIFTFQILNEKSLVFQPN